MPDREKRRENLARAVWSVMAERGLSAVSIRSVAAEAGVSVGSLQHLFPTREDLLVYSAELMIERVNTRIAAENGEGDPIDASLRFLLHLLPLTPESREEMHVNIALIAESRALPKLQSVRDRAHQEIRDGCAMIVHTLAPGLDPAQTDTATTRLHALIDGLAIRLLHLPPQADQSAIIAALQCELQELRQT